MGLTPIGQHKKNDCSCFMNARKSLLNTKLLRNMIYIAYNECDAKQKPKQICIDHFMEVFAGLQIKPLEIPCNRMN